MSLEEVFLLETGEEGSPGPLWEETDKRGGWKERMALMGASTLEKNII